jgi:hypothetical protein
MRRILIATSVPLVAALGLWLGSLTSAQARPVPGVGHRIAPAVAVVAPAVAVAHHLEADTDNVQSGDQTSPDTSSSATEDTATSGSEGQNTSESVDGSSQDGTTGHADPPGNVNYECTGNCQQ